MVIFTVSPDAPFSSYALESLQYKDVKLSVYFETQEMMEDTLILLRFNCPDSECAYIGNGWGDLRLHVRATHGKLMWFVSVWHLCCFFISNNISTVISVSDTKRFSPMNMPCTLQHF